MANEKVFQSRIQLKHDTEENWSKATNFILKVGEIIIYDVDENNPIARFKIGDGTSSCTSLPFICSLPKAGADDNGKILSIVDGSAVWQEPAYKIQSITQSDYDALTTKDANTLYVIEV